MAIEWDAAAAAVSFASGHLEQDLLSPERGGARSVAAWRRVLAYMAVHDCEMSRGDVAERLGRSPSWVSNACTRIRKAHDALDPAYSRPVVSMVGRARQAIRLADQCERAKAGGLGENVVSLADWKRRRSA